jgi:3-phenylpropionate/trans-cinnamate dioxygenase ferredoxin subunit
MAQKHVVARVDEIAPGENLAVTLSGRPIVVFNINGEFFALLDKCPHQGARLCHGVLTGFVSADGVGRSKVTRAGEILMCPRHGWEFDVRTGQSYFDPLRTRVKLYPSEIAHGDEIVKGPYKAETFPVEIEKDYVVVSL